MISVPPLAAGSNDRLSTASAAGAVVSVAGAGATAVGASAVGDWLSLAPPHAAASRHATTAAAPVRLGRVIVSSSSA